MEGLTLGRVGAVHAKILKQSSNVSLEDRMFLETSPQFQLMAWDLPFQGWLGSAWEWCRFIQGGHDGEWQPPPLSTMQNF